MRNAMRTLLVCAVATIVSSEAGVVAAPPPARAFAAGRFALELEGMHVGFVSAAEGGLAFGEVVKEAGEEFFFKKHLGNPGYQDIRLEFGTGMDKSVYAWIALALQGQGGRKNGALLRTDFNGNVVSRLDFQRALIAEVTFPAADAAGKTPVHLTIVLTPETTSFNRNASGKVTTSLTKQQKAAFSASFQLSIAGLDTSRVSKVESMTVTLPRFSGGGGGEFCIRCEDVVPIAPTKIDFPNVVMTLSEASAGPVYEWFEDFVIFGNNDDSREKSGMLEFLTADGKSTVFTINFKNLGIFELMPLSAEAGADKIASVMAAMYCESMEFSAK